MAQGHIAALIYLTKIETPAIHNPLIVNLGTGKGISVIEMVHSFEKASGRKVPYEIVERRVGDIAESWISPQFAKQHLKSLDCLFSLESASGQSFNNLDPLKLYI